VIVAAHPDDEVIGAGALLPYLRDVRIIHTTNGSPRDLADAMRSGFVTRKEYAFARRREFECAVSIAGIHPTQCICLGYTDQEAVYHLDELCGRLRQEFARLDPDVVLTQPYEGGHPDHDATAFAVDRCFGWKGQVFEMTSYHSTGGEMITGAFLGGGDAGVAEALSKEDAARKQRMLACFKSQQAVLHYFPVVPEKFRRAPRYDFTQAPHAGALHYERLGWGITGHSWRELAGRCGWVAGEAMDQPSRA
jgi:LmbE family N-acetylglucosaminyl deacetylase